MDLKAVLKQPVKSKSRDEKTAPEKCENLH
jgi:hypothetical protein